MPEQRETTTHLCIDVNEVEQEGKALEAEGSVLIYAHGFEEYNYGDEITAKGKLLSPAGFSDFDHKGYLAEKGIYSVMIYPEIKVQAKAGSFAPLMFIDSLRQELAGSIGKILPKPQASLAEGMALGIRGSIPTEVNEDFRLSGAAHLLAISGLHVGIITMAVLAFSRRVLGRRRYYYVWLSLAFIWFFAITAGFAAPVGARF